MLAFKGLASSLLLLTSSSILAQDGGLKTLIAFDGLAAFAVDKASDAPDKFELRGVELGFYAPIDTTFEGYVSAAAHPEPKQNIAPFELHEAYISSSKLLPRSRIRLGQYFLGIGRLNQFHPHDWPFISSPSVHAKFLDAEGLIDKGLEYNWLVPSERFLELSVGISNGRSYGHAHEEGERPRVNTHYARAMTYFEPFALPSQMGISYLARESAEGQRLDLWGWDWVSKAREAKILRWLWQSEIWHRASEQQGARTERSLGAYGFLSYGWNEVWSTGLRLDYLSVLSAENSDGSHATNQELGAETLLAYRSSEFATFRLAYLKQVTQREGLKTLQNAQILLQTIFILGAHPAHDF